MKQILSLSSAMFILCIASYAFTNGADNIKVHLPMAAHIGETKLPAGDYTIGVMDTNSGGLMLEVISNAGVHILVPANRQDQEMNQKTNLVLVEDGKDYRVSEVHVAGRSYSYDLLVSTVSTK